MKIYSGFMGGKYSVRFYGDDKSNYINAGNTKEDCYNAVKRDFTKAYKKLRNEKSLTIYYGEWVNNQRKREENCVHIFREDEYQDSDGSCKYGNECEFIRTRITVVGKKNGKTVRVIDTIGKWRKNPKFVE